MGFQNPNLGQKHISRIAVTVFIADYFFWRPYRKSLTDMFIRLVRISLSSSVYSEIKCYNENYNFNETFEYDISVMLIRALFGLNKQQKYIQRY